jgi:predicted acetyltransferase
MSASPVVIRALDERDISAALDLIYAEWPEIPRACQEAMIRHDPWRDRQQSFGAFVEGHLVAHARLHHRPVRMGRACLNMAGVCEVVTHPDHRRQGYGHRVLKAAIDWMRASGTHFAVLYTGVHPFYAAVGWGTLEETFWYVPLDSVPRLGNGNYHISRLSIGNSPSPLADIYERSCGQHPISLRRTPVYWQSWPLWANANPWFGTLDDVWTVARTEDTVAGYGAVQRSLLRSDSVAIIEACVLPDHDDALFDICDALVERCRTAGARSIELNLPADHCLVSRLSPVGEQTANRNAMVRVIEPAAMLRALSPELELRSKRFTSPAQVRLRSPLGSATLSLNRGGVTIDDTTQAPVADLSPAGLGSLLLGFRPAPALAEAGELHARTATVELLDLLFPGLDSHYWQIDHF